MPDFRELITREAKTLRSLHETVHETFRRRDEDRQTWSDACAAFHGYRSAMDPYLEQIGRKQVVRADGVIEFMITFLEVDPWFFRSGYEKTTMLRRLKQVPLDDKQSVRLRTVALDAVLRRPHREFSDYCRLARALQTPDFVGNVKRLAAGSSNGSVRSRARKMLHVMAS